MTARVLLVEDDALIRESLCDALRVYGYNVHAVVDGYAALDLIQRAPPDILICDVLLPKLDGFQLLAAIRSDRATQRLPVILLTAKVGHADACRGRDLGADAYITKPFELDEVLHAMQRCLHLPHPPSEC